MSDTAFRLAIARQAVESAGAALMRLPRGVRAEERADQLKTSADAAAEAWVVAFLAANFPGERILAEEAYEADPSAWKAAEAFWTVDALDGTRSFAEGFDGFCVQVAFVRDAVVEVGVIYEPVLDQTYFSTRGEGAFLQPREGGARRLRVSPPRVPPRFVDSTRPRGLPGRWFDRHHAELVELGSIGLKIGRLADGTADIFLKKLRFKLWDVAPGALILEEAGGAIGVWSGEPIVYDGSRVHFENILGVGALRLADVATELASESPAEP